METRRVSLKTLLLFPTAEKVLSEDINCLAEKIKELCPTRSYNWALKKAEVLKGAASRDPFQQNLYHSHLISLKMYIQILLEYQEHVYAETEMHNDEKEPDKFVSSE